MRFSQCYSLNSILDYRKIGKILPKCILFLQNMILNIAIRSIPYDNRQISLRFQRILFSLGLVSTNMKCVMDAFFKKEFTASIKKNGEMTQRKPKSYYSVLFLVWKYAKSKHMGLFFKSHFKHVISKVAVCPSGPELLRWFRRKILKMFWFEYSQIIFFSWWFLNIYLKSCW